MLRSTGHDKLFQTAVLSVNMDGSKNIPFIVFKGKGTSRSAEAKQLREREDVVAVLSDNGWINSMLVCQWLESVFTEVDISQPALLVWDSFCAHIYTDIVKKTLHNLNIKTVIIPGGCTSKLQTLDVCINHPL